MSPEGTVTLSFSFKTPSPSFVVCYLYCHKGCLHLLSVSLKCLLEFKQFIFTSLREAAMPQAQEGAFQCHGTSAMWALPRGLFSQQRCAQAAITPAASAVSEVQVEAALRRVGVNKMKRAGFCT